MLNPAHVVEHLAIVARYGTALATAAAIEAEEQTELVDVVAPVRLLAAELLERDPVEAEVFAFTTAWAAQLRAMGAAW